MVPYTGRHGDVLSGNRLQTARPRACANGSGPGTAHATTIASPAAVSAYHVPVTVVWGGTSARGGTSPLGTFRSKAFGMPGGMRFSAAPPPDGLEGATDAEGVLP